MSEYAARAEMYRKMTNVELNTAIIDLRKLAKRFPRDASRYRIYINMANRELTERSVNVTVDDTVELARQAARLLRSAFHAAMVQP